MQLSNPQLRAAYHQWMMKAPTVRWRPVPLFVGHLVIHFNVWRADGCGWVYQLSFLPITALMGLETLRLLDSLRPEVRSTMRLVVVLGTQISDAALFILDDRGYYCLGAAGVGSKLTAPMTVMTAASVVVIMFVFLPMLIKHLKASMGIISVLVVALTYTHYLNCHSSSAPRDPSYSVLMSMVMLVALTCQVGFSVRYYCAMLNLVHFVESLPAVQHQD